MTNAHPHTCGGCPHRWGGYNTCHCATCHTTFGGIKTFDRHRRDGVCHPPHTLGLELNNTRGVWVDKYSTQRNDTHEATESQTETQTTSPTHTFATVEEILAEARKLSGIFESANTVEDLFTRLDDGP